MPRRALTPNLRHPPPFSPPIFQPVSNHQDGAGICVIGVTIIMSISMRSWIALTAALAAIVTVDAAAPHRQARQGEEVADEPYNADCGENIQEAYWCARATPETCAAADDEVRTLCAERCCGIEPCAANAQNWYNGVNWDGWCSTRATPQACTTSLWVRRRCDRDCCEPGMSPRPIYLSILPHPPCLK